MSPVFAINHDWPSSYVFGNLLIKSVHAPRTFVKLFHFFCRITLFPSTTYAEQSVGCIFQRNTCVSPAPRLPEPGEREPGATCEFVIKSDEGVFSVMGPLSE